MAPLVTWLPMLVAKFSWIPLPPYQAAPEGIDVWHSQVFYLVAFCIVAALVGAQDRWLGAALLMIGLTIFIWGGTFDLTHSVLFMLGALALWAMRHMPQEHRPLVIACLAASGIFQAVYIIQQMFGYDVLWIDLWGVHAPSVHPAGTPLAGEPFRLRALGTLGGEDAAACYIAITAPLMPIWALPLAGAAVLKGNPEGHSLTAVVAFLVGLFVRYHRWTPRVDADVLARAKPFPAGANIAADVIRLTHLHGIAKARAPWIFTGTLIVAASAVATWILWKVQKWHLPTTLWGRLEIWQLAVEDWWHSYAIPGIWAKPNPITGNGEWFPRIPILQKQLGRTLTGEAFREAHNDWLQWGYKYGLLGVSLLGLWLWEHRWMFADRPVGASLVALAIAALGFFPFHVVSLSLLAICLIALATPDFTQEVA